MGRRREAVARVRLYPVVQTPLAWNDQVIKKGEIFVNKKPIEQYFASLLAKKTAYLELFRVTNTMDKFTFTIWVKGGGLSGQFGAVIQGIARALSIFDQDKFHSVLKKRGFLTRDARARERRKVGMGGKARRVKQSPKR